MSLVLVAASFRSCAPIFSYGSSSSISLATVTPSCVTVGAPNFLSSATLRPFGPSVVETASASLSTPRFRLRRASSEKTSCFAIVHYLLFLLLLDNGENIGFSEDQDFLAIQFDFGASILGIQHLVTLLDIHRDQFAIFVTATCAHRDNRALLRLLFG